MMMWYEALGVVVVVVLVGCSLWLVAYNWRSAAPLWREPRERTAEERAQALVARQLRRQTRR